jgi:hypothetical protein
MHVSDYDDRISHAYLGHFRMNKTRKIGYMTWVSAQRMKKEFTHTKDEEGIHAYMYLMYGRRGSTTWMCAQVDEAS